MQDAARDALAHRDAGGLELVVLRHARLVRVAAARIHQQADLHAAVPRVDELVGIARVGDEPVAHGDFHGLLLDVLQDVGAAVLERGVAQAILGCQHLSRGSTRAEIGKRANRDERGSKHE